MSLPYTRGGSYKENMAEADRMRAASAASSANTAASSGGGPKSSISEQFTTDSIGLMGNPVFARFVGSLEPQDRDAAIELRREWLAQQQSHYGDKGDQREDALNKLAMWGGNSAAVGKPSGPKQRYTYYDNDTGMDVTIGSDLSTWDPTAGYVSASNAFDEEKAYSFLRRLQSNINERNLGTYNEIVKISAGVCGSLDKQGLMIPKLPGKSWRDFNKPDDPRMLYAVAVLKYNYNGGSTRGFTTWAQYQQNLLETAQDEINEGNFNGLFTDANSRFDDYQGVSLSDLNVSAERLGTMANRYNRYITELYLHIANMLSRAGVTLPNDGSGVDEQRLASEVQRVAGTKTWRGSGVSRLSSEGLASLQGSFKTWQSYKAAMGRLEAVSSKLRGLKWAQFMVAYCGGEDAEGTDKYWPWWEPNQQETEDLYWKAIDILDRWRKMNDNYDEAVAAGDVTAVRPKESDLEKEPEPFTAAAVPGANVSHPVTPMPSQRPVEGANGGNAGFFK